ncbi:hypothetical protein ACN4EK_07240 [Pantanalinema rosaneae CENA516]|uniref:hypothetical protein n=1 Tax=Pantanalinema rosaneae TaxID=1620701 RepID=UPI003D6F8B65
MGEQGVEEIYCYEVIIKLVKLDGRRFSILALVTIIASIAIRETRSKSDIKTGLVYQDSCTGNPKIINDANILPEKITIFHSTKVYVIPIRLTSGFLPMFPATRN